MLTIYYIITKLLTEINILGPIINTQTFGNPRLIISLHNKDYLSSSRQYTSCHHSQCYQSDVSTLRHPKFLFSALSLHVFLCLPGAVLRHLGPGATFAHSGIFYYEVGCLQSAMLPFPSWEVVGIPGKMIKRISKVYKTSTIVI